MSAVNFGMESQNCLHPVPCEGHNTGNAIETGSTTTQQMGPVGPWAGGKLNYGPFTGFTGTQPIVDRYSITRFSVPEWHDRNSHLVHTTNDVLHTSREIDYDIKQKLEVSREETDKIQENSTNRLQYRAQEILRWKCELEQAIIAMKLEITELEAERARLLQADAVLTSPEMIVGEAIDLRTGRVETELIRDDVEEELMKEYALIHEIRNVFERTLERVDQQMFENRTAKAKLEFDWSDKAHACDVDMLNASLNNKSNLILFRPGSTKFQMQQSTPEHWEEFTKEALEHSELIRQKSISLRNSLNLMLTNAARDLRSQADRVENALQQKINAVSELLDTLEEQLRQVLKSISDMEIKANETDDLIRRLDSTMKVAQTRLDNRELRMGVENCRDPSQYGLINEVKRLGETVTSLRKNFEATDSSIQALVEQRGELERNIMFLRKTLLIDRDRIGKIRLNYPSTIIVAPNVVPGEEAGPPISTSTPASNEGLKKSEGLSPLPTPCDMPKPPVPTAPMCVPPIPHMPPGFGFPMPPVPPMMNPMATTGISAMSAVETMKNMGDEMAKGMETQISTWFKLPPKIRK
ncbi:tektin-4-like [Chrysoperla carnea]|uniref:tektin-4-like n=1 Tax=Chrysoperla carnea TaxID=189513 RepID=UPI001D08C9AA|nr:tektin-4-like [Chrysoperla carnea]